MKYCDLCTLITGDLYRYGGARGWRSLLRELWRNPGFKYSFWLRVCHFLRTTGGLALAVYVPARWMLERYRFRFGINIPVKTEIGPGFYIGHYGGIVVNEKAFLGANCNISQDVTIGITNRGARQGVPHIGDNVYIGPGARIIGNVRVGHGAAIGANCVVTHDVPDGAVVVGVPGRVISYAGSAGYVEHTDY